MYLSLDIKNYIFQYVKPTKEQMIKWKFEHYLNYYKVLADIEDVIIEVYIDQTGLKHEYFSLFSWSILYDCFV